MSCYVILHHTNLEYCVIKNHLSASELQLAPRLTHALFGHRDDCGASDTRTGTISQFWSTVILSMLTPLVVDIAIEYLHSWSVVKQNEK